MSRVVTPKGSKGPSVKQVAFLAAYSKIGLVTLAAEMAGIDRRSHSFWLQQEIRRREQGYPYLVPLNWLEAHQHGHPYTGRRFCDFLPSEKKSAVPVANLGADIEGFFLERPRAGVGLPSRG
jgi:hypothetical protein